MKALRLQRAALGVALGALAAVLIPSGRPAGGPRPSGPCPALEAFGPGCFEDATRGRLADVVVHYVPAMGKELAAVYSHLLAALEPDTTVFVVVSEPTAFGDLEERLDRLGRPPRARLAAVPVGHPITGWAKDRFVSWVPGDRVPMDRPTADRVPGHRAPDDRVRHDRVPAGPGSPDRILIIPPRPADSGGTRAGDWMVPADLSERSGGRWRRVIAPLVFDGGDFAAAGSSVLAGWTLMAKNPDLAAAGKREAERFLSSLAGRPVLLLGDEDAEVPEHHVNMFAIPLDDRRALVGDPRLAASRLGGEETARGRLAAAGIDADFSRETAERFDRAAEELAARGFGVSRVPAVPLAGRRAYGPHVTYTNALVETFPDGRKRVYLPAFGIDDLDRIAAETWERLGFEVRSVDVGPVFLGGGTLDCLVGVVRRAAG